MVAQTFSENTSTPTPVTHQPQFTPSNSVSGRIITDGTQRTPYDALRHLANIPKPATPLQRASSAGPPSTHQSVHRTPGGLQRPASTRRPTALTPHARAAYRENELRRQAALTPGRERRRSGRQQRDTPRDPLRQLSRLLAPVTKRPDTSPVVPGPPDGKTVLFHDDLEDGQVLIRPRLSMPLGDEEDEDDSYLLPPYSAGLLEDDDYTQQSIELPRRAISEQPGGRYSRGSFGSIRTSDRFGDLNDIGLDALGSEGFDPSFVRDFEAFDPNLAYDSSVIRENTADLGRAFLDDDIRRLSATPGRISDIIPTVLREDDTENSFVLTVPPRDIRPTSPSIDAPNLDPAGGEDQFEDETILDDEASIDAEEIEQQNFDQTDAGGDISMQDMSVLEHEASGHAGENPRKSKKGIRVSKHGTHYSLLPLGVVKKLATTFLRTSGNSKTKLSKDTLEALMQATEWFFEQVSDDLGTYAAHAGRKTIDESDMLTLMKRQRQTNATTTPFALAQRYLPRELLQDLRMAPPSKVKRRLQLDSIEEEAEVELGRDAK